MLNWERWKHRSSVLIQNQHHQVSCPADLPLGFCPCTRTWVSSLFYIPGLVSFSTPDLWHCWLRVTLSVREHFSSCQPVSALQLRALGLSCSSFPGHQMFMASGPYLWEYAHMHVTSEFVYTNAGYEWSDGNTIYKSQMFLSCMTKSQPHRRLMQKEMLGVWGSCSWRTQFLKLQGLHKHSTLQTDSFMSTSFSFLHPFTLCTLILYGSACFISAQSLWKRGVLYTYGIDQA